MEQQTSSKVMRTKAFSAIRKSGTKCSSQVCLFCLLGHQSLQAKMCRCSPCQLLQPVRAICHRIKTGPYILTLNAAEEHTVKGAYWMAGVPSTRNIKPQHGNKPQSSRPVHAVGAYPSPQLNKRTFDMVQALHNPA